MELVEWFRGRGISRRVLEMNGVQMERRFCSSLGETVEHIAFPFYRDGVVVNVKYRALPKHFSQVKGGQQILYGVDQAKGAEEVIIVEGEMDKLAVEEGLLHRALDQGTAAHDGGTTSTDPAAAGGNDSREALPQPVFLSPFGGRRAVVSVPAGAPSKASGSSTALERKFQFLEAASDTLKDAARIVLAVDADEPGVVLAGELARRLGREKCLVATWPTSHDTSLAPPDGAAAQEGDWARKDACEVLEKDGPAVLAAYIDAAKPVPIRGLYRFDDFWSQVYDLYSQGPRGLSWGVSTGWPTLDEYYKVVPGELTVVTGLTNSGKSEWLDALIVNLGRNHGWRVGMCSLENTREEHARKLVEKYTGKAVLDADYSVGAARLTRDEQLGAIMWIDEHVHRIDPGEEVPSIDWILDKARSLVLRYGIQGLVIDPYNELDNSRPRAMSETEHISRMLTKVKRFAQHLDCHVWLVAHPRTQRGPSGNTAPPTLYDVSGSAHFINKADNGVVVHRPHPAGAAAAAEGKDPRLTQVLLRKVRNKLAGRIGDVKLLYDVAVGRYSDVSE